MEEIGEKKNVIGDVIIWVIHYHSIATCGKMISRWLRIHRLVLAYFYKNWVAIMSSKKKKILSQIWKNLGKIWFWILNFDPDHVNWFIIRVCLVRNCTACWICNWCSNTACNLSVKVNMIEQIQIFNNFFFFFYNFCVYFFVFFFENNCQNWEITPSTPR